MAIGSIAASARRGSTKCTVSFSERSSIEGSLPVAKHRRLWLGWQLRGVPHAD
jgi:hypothetical protein